MIILPENIMTGGSYHNHCGSGSSYAASPPQQNYRFVAIGIFLQTGLLRLGRLLRQPRHLSQSPVYIIPHSDGLFLFVARHLVVYIL